MNKETEEIKKEVKEILKVKDSFWWSMLIIAITIFGLFINNYSQGKQIKELAEQNIAILEICKRLADQDSTTLELMGNITQMLTKTDVLLSDKIDSLVCINSF